MCLSDEINQKDVYDDVKFFMSFFSWLKCVHLKIVQLFEDR
jgi:hypothetical protein